MTMNAPWTDEDIKIAQDMYTEGKSFTDIGQRLGRTRNSIAGLANRMHFPRRPKQKKIAPPKLAPIKAAPVNIIPRKKLVPVAPTPDVVTAKTIIDLEPNDCRWPSGDEDFVFCAAPRLEGHPYCLEHYKLAYVPRRVEIK